MQKCYTIKQIATHFGVSTVVVSNKLKVLGVESLSTGSRNKLYPVEALRGWKPEIRSTATKPGIQMHQQIEEILKEINTLHAKLDALAQENAILEQKVDVLEGEQKKAQKVVKALGTHVLKQRKA